MLFIFFNFNILSLYQITSVSMPRTMYIHVFFYPRVIAHHSHLYLVGIRNVWYSCKAEVCFSLLEIEEKKILCVYSDSL